LTSEFEIDFQLSSSVGCTGGPQTAASYKLRALPPFKGMPAVDVHGGGGGGGATLMVSHVGRLPTLKVCLAYAMEVRFQSAVWVCLFVQDVEYIWWCCAWGVCLRKRCFCMCNGSATFISSLG